MGPSKADFLCGAIVMGLAIPGVAASTENAPSTLRNGPNYPWNLIPEKCREKVPPIPAACKFEDWPDHDEAKAKLTLLYKTEQFQLLERALEEVSASSKVADSGWPLQTIVYNTFSSWFPSATFDVQAQARINRWKKAMPQSNFVALAEASFLTAHAWNIRGNGYADTVSKESWRLFERYQREAETVLLAATPRLRNHPAWYHKMINIVQDLEAPSRRAEELFNEAILKWPNYYPLFEPVASRMQPKWGASWKMLESFASKWAAHYESTQNDGGAVYARIFIAVRNDASLDEIRPDWGKLKRGFAALIAQQPSYVNYRNYYASFACAAGDKETFMAAMKLLNKDTLKPAAWIKGHSYDACTSWAYEKT